jgi:S1-C subfamily serine protease
VFLASSLRLLSSCSRGGRRVCAVLALAALLTLSACTQKVAPNSGSNTTRNSAPSSAQQAATSRSTPGGAGVASTAAPSSGAVSPASASFQSVVRDVVQKVKPAVVQITNQQVQPGAFGTGGITVPAGVGSGFIYDNQGHILTNDHVVAGAQSLLVTLPDGRTFPGRLIGADSQTDLAVVQISGSNLPVVPLGDSSKLQVGDWVVAIGNALALPGGPTVTQGVVSALGRSVQEPPPEQNGNGGNPFFGGAPQQAAGPYLFDLIQTDAPINPGNSGGPLVDLNGNVIGINTLAAGQAEPGVQAEGIGFAIAIDTAKPIADQLVAHGSVQHAYLGIGYLPLTPAIAAQLGVSAKNGAVILQVQSGGPAAQAGLQPNDVITQVDGKDLVGDSALPQAISQHKPGDTVTLTVQRGNRQISVKVTLGQMPAP